MSDERCPIELDESSKTHLETLRLARAELAKLKEATESWEAIANQAKEAVEDFLGEHESGRIDGAEVVTYTHGTRTSVDVTRLRAEIPAPVLAPYLSKKPTRRFTVKE